LRDINFPGKGELGVSHDDYFTGGVTLVVKIKYP